MIISPAYQILRNNIKTNYLDEEIMQFPLSEIYTARVLQVYWSEITEVRRAILASMIELMENDEFLKVAKFISETAVGQEIASKCPNSTPK